MVDCLLQPSSKTTSIVNRSRYTFTKILPALYSQISHVLYTRCISGSHPFLSLLAFMETRQRQRVERLRQQTCHNFNQGIEKDLCLKKRPAGDNEDDKCILKLKHWCSICTCPGHGSNRCRDHIRDDSTPNPDNVTIQYVNPGRLQNGVSAPSVFAQSPPPLRDDSTPNPDNVTIQYVEHGRLQNGVSVPSIFAPSPPPYTAQAAIKRDYRRQRGDSRKFTIEWDHSELLSARYNQYRQKQRSPKTRDKKEVWPDDLEESFQIGT